MLHNKTSTRGFTSNMNNKITKSLLVLAAGGLMFVGAASAQTQDSNTSGAGPGQVDPSHPRVNEVNGRETNQQDRIANGVKRIANRILRTSRRPIWPLTTVT
jgi:uncharacterized lipoprotein YajG